MSRSTHVVGIVNSVAQAEKLIESLKDSGFSPENISALLADRRDTADFAIEHHIQFPKGAIVGAGQGGMIGSMLGLLAGASVLSIPSLGPFIAAGPLMATLSGVAVGSMVGALVGFGIPELDAKAYEGRLRAGGILLAVEVANYQQTQRARYILQGSFAHDCLL